MLKLFDSIKVFVVIQFVWKIFPIKRLQTIRLFAATEDDSAWQLLYGMKNLENPKKKLNYLRKL